jgi:hypothetical protein
VTILRIAGSRQVSVELLPVAGGGPLKLTPREDMDRVQALDVQLGNLWDFAEKNPVFLKDGQLVADCQSGAPARIRIDSLGNPIDLPVEVEVGFQSETAGVALDAPTFGAGLCQTGAGGCVLAPAARTNFANYSSVDVQSGCPVPQAAVPQGSTGGNCVPVWQAGLKVSGGPAPTAGTALAFSVRTSFTGASGKLFVEKTVQTAVKACP